MLDNPERREEIRVPLNTNLGFNILDNPNAFVRGSALDLHVFQASGKNHTLNENEPLEAFLVQLDRKIDFLIDLMGEKLYGKKYQYSGEVLNISESGLRMDFPDYIPNDAYLEIGLTLPNYPHRIMEIAAQVLWRMTQKDKNTGQIRNVVGLSFHDILSEDQETIVHFIFQKQRENIRSLRG